MKNKFLLTAILLTSGAFAGLPVHADELKDRIAAVPNPRATYGGWVSDPYNILATRKADIDRLISEHERETSDEVAVVVLPTIGKIVPKEFATELFNTWKIGKAKKNNGVLVLHVLDQRRIEIETGYGAEGPLPDIKCKWILDEVVIPYFKEGSFADGHYEGVRAILRALSDPEIGHDALISGTETKPGESVQTIPKIPERDEITLKNMPPLEKSVYDGRMTGWLGAGGAGLFVLGYLVYWLFGMGRDPYKKYKIYQGAGFPFHYGAALAFGGASGVFEYGKTETWWSGIPVWLVVSGLIAWMRNSKLQALRNEPRICECGKTMRKLSEDEDDSYLQKGNVAEEKIHSMDYDVWVCECGKHRIEAYSGDSPADKCEKCGFKTYQVSSTTTLRAATTSSEGLREIVYLCANCAHTETVRETIPRISTSSSSSSSSSSSGGSSFGGGSSGGGGAGSSY